MSVFEVTEKDTDLLLRLDMPRNDALDPQLLDIVIPGVATEDMCVIDANEMANSYAIYSAFTPEKVLAGTVRQLARHYLPVIEDAPPICVSELGTLWVNPELRKQGIARSLVQFAAQTMDMVSIIPVAVCNNQGDKVFTKVGFETIGKLVSRDDGKSRTVQISLNCEEFFKAREFCVGLFERE